MLPPQFISGSRSRHCSHTFPQGKALSRLQHSFQGRCWRVPGGLSHFHPHLLSGDGDLQFVAQVGDTGDFQLGDIVWKGGIKEEAGPCDPGKAGVCQGENSSSHKGAQLGEQPPLQASPPRAHQSSLKELLVHPRISGQIPNTLMEHLMRRNWGHDSTAHPKIFLSYSSYTAGAWDFHRVRFHI